MQGAFTVAEKLWGITFKAVKDIDIYHSEVTTYEVYDKDGCNDDDDGWAEDCCLGVF